MTGFTPPSFAEINRAVASATVADVRQALAAPGALAWQQLAALLSPAADSLLPAMAAASRALTRQRFGRVVQLFAPIYLSNYCANRCLYCGFSADNSIDRRVLTLDEAVQEGRLLHQRGFQHILLVSGEAPARLGVDFLQQVARRLRGMFASVAIEVQPLATEEYARLFEDGITSVTVYQETYDRECYQQLHLAGPKSDYEKRLEIPARAARAGMREVGIGTLLGLSDWRLEGIMLGLHLAWLRKQFWRTAFTVSFPRLRPAPGGFAPRIPVTEKDLAQLIFALRIFDPDVGLVLSTRESQEFRDHMLGLGPTRYSAGSCTVPGGYLHPELAGEQFSVGDHRSLNEVKKATRAAGLDPVSKDWDQEFQSPRAQEA